MKKSTLEKCRKKLLEMKQTLLNKKSSEELKIDTDVQDEGDSAQDLSNKDLALILSNKEFNTLKQIEEALSKIEDGTYGICVDTDEKIEEKRLLANPLALRTLEAQESYEKELKRN
jgi:DnaK suppressor protein